MRASHPPAPAVLRAGDAALQPRGTGLEGRWLACAVLFALGIAAMGAGFVQGWGIKNALSWAAGAGLFAIGILGFVWRHRDENRRDARSQRLETFGPGNAITLTRGLMLAMTGGFLFAPRPTGFLVYVPAILYTSAIVADLFDGVAARRADFSTLLGARLDIELDGFGVLLAFLLAVHLGQLPTWFIVVGLGRPLFTLGLSWRKRSGRDIHELPSSRHRKLLAGIQMGFLSAALWPVMSRHALTLLGLCLLLPTIVGFLRDWLVVSGRATPSGPTYGKLHRWTARLVARDLPTVIRVLSPLALVWLFIQPLSGSAALTGLAIVGILSILLGLVGRAGAIAVIVAIGIHSGSTALDTWTAVVFAGAAGVLLFGTGPMSLLKPEEPYVLSDVRAEA